LIDQSTSALNSFDFIALIRIKRGDYFHEDYSDIESFRKEMKEHIDDIAWGTLFRRETGTPVDFFRPGERLKIGLVDPEPKSSAVVPEGLNPRQAALREAAIKHFRSIKVKKFTADQIENINASQQFDGELRKLFDEHGNPPKNLPLEDIIAERNKTEYMIRLLEAICSEMRNNLKRIEED
jgi:hypothetical protein